MENLHAAVPGNPLAALSDALAAVVDRVAPATLAVLGRRRRAIASAVMWQSGIAVTAAHVLRHAGATVTVLPADGKPVDATLVGTDSSTDIAVLRLSDDAPMPAQVGDASAVKAGHLVLAVGRSADAEPAASYGIVNRASGPWQTWLGGQMDRLIRLDGGLYEGLSGAAVADAQAQVIGMASAALSRSYGIVVPSSTVSRVVEAVLGKGHVARAFIGIGAQPVAVPRSAAGSANDTGLLVTALVADGPADRAGLIVGDILLRAGATPVSSLHDLRDALVAHIGKSVELSILRGGEAMSKAIVVGEWPQRRRPC